MGKGRAKGQERAEWKGVRRRMGEDMVVSTGEGAGGKGGAGGEGLRRRGGTKGGAVEEGPRRRKGRWGGRVRRRRRGCGQYW